VASLGGLGVHNVSNLYFLSFFPINHKLLMRALEQNRDISFFPGNPFKNIFIKNQKRRMKERVERHNDTKKGGFASVAILYTAHNRIRL